MMWESYARLRPPPAAKKVAHKAPHWEELEEEDLTRLLERSGRALVPAPPASLGVHLTEVDTPALVVDLDALERNLQRMSYFCKQHGLRHRPSVKTHKCLNVALRQMELGAVGVACQKVSEAEVMVRGGNIQDVLVTTPVCGYSKVRRLVRLAKEADRVGVAIDDANNAAMIAEVAESMRMEVDVYIMLRPHHHHPAAVGGPEGGGGKNHHQTMCGGAIAGAGVSSAMEAVRLAKGVQQLRGLNLMGLLVCHGAEQEREVDPLIRREGVLRQAAPLAQAAKQALLDHGLPCPIVTGGGTATFHWACASKVYDEVQAGSYVFMDAEFGRNRVCKSEPHFEQALFILAGVHSRCGGGDDNHATGRLVVDAGYKAMGMEGLGQGGGLPLVLTPRALAQGVPSLPPHGALVYSHAADEYGVVNLVLPPPPLQEEEEEGKGERREQQQDSSSSSGGRGAQTSATTITTIKEEEEQEEEEESCPLIAPSTTTTTTTEDAGKNSIITSTNPATTATCTTDVQTKRSSQLKKKKVMIKEDADHNNNCNNHHESESLRAKALSLLPVAGQKLVMVPSHCDSTTNLHDWLVGVRGGRVDKLWRVAARGAVF